MLNAKLTFVVVWVEMPGVTEMSDRNEQNYDFFYHWALFLIYKRTHILPLK